MRKIAPSLVLAAASCLAITAAAQRDAPAPFVGNTAELTRDSSDFRRVVHTGEHVQLVLMTLQPGEDIGAETHPETDQCLFIVEGVGSALLGGQTSELTEDSVVCVPAGTEHDIINTGSGPLRLFTVYGPPQHAPDTVHATRADARAAEGAEE